MCHTYLVASNQAVAQELRAIRVEVSELRDACANGIKQTGVGNQVINDGGREQTIREELKRSRDSNGDMR